MPPVAIVSSSNNAANSVNDVTKGKRNRDEETVTT
jgi:hypothetical protein